MIELLSKLHERFYLAHVNGLSLPNDWIQLAPYLKKKGFNRIEELPEERIKALIAWYDQQIAEAESLFGREAEELE